MRGPLTLTLPNRMRHSGCESGIAIHGIRPGHPQQNGRHDRMHLTLKTEATRYEMPGGNSKSWGGCGDLEQPEVLGICNLQITGSQSSQDSRGCRSTLQHLTLPRYRRNGESHITRLPLNTTVSLPDLNEVFLLPKACEALNANSFTA
jgi:hypothetical protein